MQTRKILLVDDEASLCRVMKLNLEETGRFEVRTETLGSRVLSVALEYQPDCIILDYIMRDMDGGDVVMQLEGHAETKNIPVIFLTAIATKEDTQGAGHTIGGRCVLSKPIDVDELIASIDSRIRKNV